MTRANDYKAFYEKKCSVCGKNFVLPPYNIYKILTKNGSVHQCSYACWRKAGGGKQARMRIYDRG